MIVVVARSYSRISGQISEEVTTSGIRSRRIAATCRSWAGLAYACSRHTAAEPMPRAAISAAARRTEAGSSGVSTSPRAETRSTTSKQSPGATGGGGGVKRRS